MHQKRVFFKKKQLFEDEISIWKEIKGAESFNPIEKCWVKNQSLHQNRAQTQKKTALPTTKEDGFTFKPVPSRSLIRSGLLFSFFLQGGPTTSF